MRRRRLPDGAPTAEEGPTPPTGAGRAAATRRRAAPCAGRQRRAREAAVPAGRCARRSVARGMRCDAVRCGEMR
eukprot:1999353-Prymnesium_polylepis.1